MSQAPTPPYVTPATLSGFWLRLPAAIIDLLVLAVPLAAFISFLSVAMGISTAFLNLSPGQPPSEILKNFGNTFIDVTLAFFILISWLYFAILESSRWRATLGKRAVGIYVADRLGNRVTFARAAARFCFGRLLVHIPILGIYYFLIDCLSIFFTQHKQAVHDIFSNCLVMRENATGPLAGPGK
jgi:uncharacterized RDD family membrane protein YckC